MIELFEQNIRTNERQSSNGNQLKWENNGIWYKADYTGYEGLAEYMISHLLKKSTLAEDEFVCYDLEKIKYGTVIYNGVKSRNFPGQKNRSEPILPIRSGTEQQIIRYTEQEPSKSLKSLNDRQSTDDYRRTRECRLRQHS